MGEIRTIFDQRQVSLRNAALQQGPREDARAGPEFDDRARGGRDFAGDEFGKGRA
jgi:hypothetical protein